MSGTPTTSSNSIFSTSSSSSPSPFPGNKYGIDLTPEYRSDLIVFFIFFLVVILLILLRRHRLRNGRGILCCGRTFGSNWNQPIAPVANHHQLDLLNGSNYSSHYPSETNNVERNPLPLPRQGSHPMSEDPLPVYPGLDSYYQSPLIRPPPPIYREK